MLSSPGLRWEILEVKYGASKDADINFLYVCCRLLCCSFILYLCYFTLIPGLRMLEWIRQPFRSGEVGKRTSKQAVAIQVTWHNKGKLSLWERSLLWWPRLWMWPQVQTLFTYRAGSALAHLLIQCALYCLSCLTFLLVSCLPSIALG